MTTQYVDRNNGSETSGSSDMRFVQEPPEETRKPPTVYASKLLHTHTMIVLHGRGDTGQRFGAFFTLSSAANDESLDDILAHTKFIFPSAKLGKVASASGKYKITVNQWFDIESLIDPNRGEGQQIEGLRDSSLHVREIIEEELKTIPAENIVLVGLSQGCATALFTLLTYTIPNPEGKRPPPALGAVVGMSGWLPFEKRVNELFSAIQSDKERSASFSTATSGPGEKVQPSDTVISIKALSTICTLCGLDPLTTSSLPPTPIFLGHGTSDELVSVRLGEKARDTLQVLGFEVEWFPYEGFGVRTSLRISNLFSTKTSRKKQISE